MRHLPGFRSRDEGWTVVVPVKRYAVAKSRLASYAGPHRPGLARAMGLDTIAATLRSPAVAEVVIVTNDSDATHVLTELGAIVVPDEPDLGLNPALVYGWQVARERRGKAPIAAMLADLPALRPHELETALTLATDHETSFVSDTPAVGTTLYCTMPGADFVPAFGGPSRLAHLSGGAIELDGAHIPTVRRDVDTEPDLREAAQLGVGPHTREILAALETVRG